MPLSTTGTLAANACQDVNVPIVSDPSGGLVAATVERCQATSPIYGLS